MAILLRLLGFIKGYRKHIVAAYVFLLLSTLLSLAIPRLLGDAIDQVLEEGEMGFIILAALGIIGASLLKGFFAYGQSYLSEYVSQRAAYDIRNALYDHLQRLSFAFHDKQQTGQLMSRVTADVDGVRWFISLGILRASSLLILFLGITGLLISTNWRLALISLAIMPLIAFRAIRISRRLRVIWQSIQHKTGEVGAVLQENLSGVRVVKAFAMESYESERFSQRAQGLAEENLASSRLQASHSSLMNFLTTTAVGIILIYGGWEIVSDRLTAGELTQFILYLLMLALPVRMTGFIINIFARAISAGERIFEILDTPSPVKEKPSARELKDVKGHIRFQGVSFHYDSAAPALVNIDFQAEPGQVIALVGAAGSGKSTIVHLIPRLYDVTQGKITIDGVDIRNVTLSSLRRSIGIVQQDIFLFSATLRDNIAYGAPEAKEDDIIAAAKAAHLHDFIQSLPQGYNTWVGERGITLSGGQKQRLAIARTLLIDPRILILDDATSSVDTETEYHIQKALRGLIKGRTTFIISQRLNSVKGADLILVLKDGQIVERGKHQELLEQEGIYKGIYELQLRFQEEAARWLEHLELTTP